MSVWMNCYKCGKQNRLTDGNSLDGRYLHKKCDKCNAPIIERQGNTVKIRAPLYYSAKKDYSKEEMASCLKDFLKSSKGGLKCQKNWTTG